MFGHRCLEKVGGLGDRSRKRKRNRRRERLPRAEGCYVLHPGVQGAPAPCAAGRRALTGCCDGARAGTCSGGLVQWRDCVVGCWWNAGVR